MEDREAEFVSIPVDSFGIRSDSFLTISVNKENKRFGQFPGLGLESSTWHTGIHFI